MKEIPTVTIITVTFNLIKNDRENFFRQCVESVHNQTYPNIEHIVVDGASTDGTVNLLQEYASKGWIKYISEHDEGIYDAMNKGIKIANGKYIAFLNSDDYYHNNAGVAASVDALEKSGADFSYAPVLIQNQNNTKTKRSPDLSSTFSIMPFSHQSMFTRKEVMLKEGMFNIDFKIAGDYDFVIRIILNRYKNIFVDLDFVSYRSGGLSEQNQKQSLDEIASIYFRHYNKFCLLRKQESKKIYGRGFDGISPELADKLKDFPSYFDYGAYISNRNTSNSLLLKIRVGSVLLMRRLTILVFLPKEFIKKSFRRLPTPIKEKLKKIYYKFNI